LKVAECVNSSENKSKDDGCQPIILKDGKEAGEIYHNDNLLENVVQTSVAICAEKDADGIFELVQQEKQRDGIGGNVEIRESAASGGKPDNNISHTVQIFHDVGYL
jgi:hypothetical protein